MGVHKDAASLGRCREKLAAIAADLPELRETDPRQPMAPSGLFLALSLPHLLTTAQAIVQAAAMREESRGPHYRTDFPVRDDERYGRPILARREGDRLVCTFGDWKPIA
jgi:succinate dehydrogenase/fumarate reductase flavoprotein subunit